MKTVIQQVVAASSKTNPGRVDYCLKNIDIPVPTQGQVLVKVRACGLPQQNHTIYEKIFSDGRASYPCGQDVAGVVTQVGQGVTNVVEGDNVVGILPLDSAFSGCGEFCLFNEYDLVKKPSMLGFEEAACGIGDCIRAYTALHYQARVCAGDTVLVLDAASSFGMVAVQLARLWGAKVIAAVGSNAEKSFLEAFLPSCGQVIEMGHRTNILVSSVMEETGGLGVDVVIDNGGGKFMYHSFQIRIFSRLTTYSLVCVRPDRILNSWFPIASLMLELISLPLSGVRMYTNEEDCQMLSERRRYPCPHKHDVISCLAVAGKWITQQMDLQLDPPDSQLLFMRGASLCFLFDAAWTLSYSQQGRYQHILHDTVEKLDRAIIKCKISKRVPIDELTNELGKQPEYRNGKVIMVNG